MLLREREFKACPTCGDRKLVRDEAHGCDQCHKVIDLANRNTPYHDVTVFFNSSTTKHIYLCSVMCVVKWIKAYEPSEDYYFMSFPLLSGAKHLREFQRHLSVTAKAERA